MSPLRDRSAYAHSLATKKNDVKDLSSSGHGAGLPKRLSRQSRYQASFRISKMARDYYAADFFAVLVLLLMATTYVLFFDAGVAERSDGLQLPRNLSMGSSIHGLSRHSPQHENKGDILSLKENYEEFLRDAPECLPLEYHEVTFGLAIALKESDLSMVSHHCKRWGILAPISIAVWANISPEHVMEKLLSFDKNECKPEQMTISTLSPAAPTTTYSETYPLNQLRNLAIQGLQTTHAVSLDIQVLTSDTLYDILHSPSTVRELAKDPRLAIVLPSFEVKDVSSHDDNSLRGIPDTFERLIIQLGSNLVSVMGSEDIALQGSTLYRSWVQQDQGGLLPIDCVASDHYEPFLAVRYCDGLPPFQEVLTGEKNNNAFIDNDATEDTKHDITSTWIMHLLRLGYRFEQVGGGFVVKLLPSTEHKMPLSEPNAEDAITINNNAASRSLRKKRNRKQQFTRQSFLKWLHQTVPDERLVDKCDDFEGSGDEIE